MGSVVNEGYELLSFRLEDDASSITLMEPNLKMEGYLLLNLGILENTTDNIYYIQEIINELDFQNLHDYAVSNFKGDDMSEEDLRSIEVDYLTLTNEQMQKVQRNSSVDVDNEVYNATTVTEGSLNNTGATRNLISLVPDSVFKSGSFDTWRSFNSNTNALYSYSYITFRFAGTENRLTSIIFIDAPVHANWNNQNLVFR